MTPEERAELVKAMSFAVGLVSSIKPEKLAEASLAAVEEKYELVEKTPRPS